MSGEKSDKRGKDSTPEELVRAAGAAERRLLRAEAKAERALEKAQRRHERASDRLRKALARVERRAADVTEAAAELRAAREARAAGPGAIPAAMPVADDSLEQDDQPARDGAADDSAPAEVALATDR